jgi:hypothetical protein
MTVKELTYLLVYLHMYIKYLHQLMAEDLMEDGAISHISNAYSLRRGRRQPPTLEVEELQLVLVIVM